MSKIFDLINELCLDGEQRGKQDINCLMSVHLRVSGAYCVAMRAMAPKFHSRSRAEF